MTSGTTGGGLTPVAQKQPKRKRSTRLALERDARAILADLEDDLSAQEILERHNWTRHEYNRRLRLAEKLLHQKDDIQPIIDLYLQRQALYKSLQAQAQARADEIRTRLTKSHADGQHLDPREEAALTTALLETLTYVGECHEKIKSSALEIESQIEDSIPDLEKSQTDELHDYLREERQPRKPSRPKTKNPKTAPAKTPENPQRKETP